MSAAKWDTDVRNKKKWGMSHEKGITMLNIWVWIKQYVIEYACFMIETILWTFSKPWVYSRALYGMATLSFIIHMSMKIPPFKCSAHSAGPVHKPRWGRTFTLLFFPMVHMLRAFRQARPAGLSFMAFSSFHFFTGFSSITILTNLKLDIWNLENSHAF